MDDNAYKAGTFSQLDQNIPGKQVLVTMCDCGKTTTRCHVDFFNVDFCNVDFL